ncbi:SpoIIE family protein phosphatase [Streptomyces sp. SL13]|uniref:SpoIIE family protein phosphatase n=1 Tax=Streptantibioticus silvisoli TaxID=2705255 RepID=A0AA90H868_9ACTN|nr:SpoIIE family protein phosphatase [Streptantibioticus silvisoli]MDI5972698.1 SpoIIE family protein phosphatase [Streptantibioticus silvisoli]
MTTDSVEQMVFAPPAIGDDRAAESDEERDLRALFGQSVAVFASLAGPDHVLESANSAFFSAIGGGEQSRTGVPLEQLIPELAGQGFLAPLDQVFRSGERHVGRDARMRLGAGPTAREAIFDFACEPRTDRAGNVIGVRVIGVETTQVKHAQWLMAEHRALLEQIARQAPLEQVLDGMARTIEELAPEEVLVSVLLADPDGKHLRHGAAPSLPDFYNRAIDGITAGEGVGSCGTAAHRRQAVVVTDIATDPYWDDFRDLADRARLAACWSTPILARDGSLLGTFAMYHRTPRAPQEADRALARLFADTAALAIERHQAEQARLAAEAREKAARDDLAFLLNTSAVLTSDLDHVQTLQRLADACVPTLAPLCAVDIVEGGRLRRVAAAAPTPGQQRLLASHACAHESVPRVLADGITEMAQHAPAGPGPWNELNVTGYLTVPLTDRGRVFGTLTLLSTGGGVLGERTAALAGELARRTASAALNARQYTQRVALAHDLQAGLLLSRTPAVPGTEIATFYHPAGEGLDVGGDFYDVFPLKDGRWAFLLGDVCGRGAIAATTTALVRHTARAVAPLLPGPDAVVQAINTALLDRPDNHGTGFVTLVHGHLTPGADGLDIELVRAGHNLPLRIADGTARPVESAGSLLGVSHDPDVAVRRLHLAPGESLLLYTDGITEARDHDGEQFGEERLSEALALRRPTAAEVIETLTAAVRAFTGPGVVDDDQAALVLTATPAATGE